MALTVGYLRLAGLRTRGGGRRRGRADGGEHRRHPEVGAADARHRRRRARRPGRRRGRDPRLRRRRRTARLGIGDDVAVGGVLQAAGLLFFAFAGYARIATLGEEVRDPARTIPRAIPIALGIALVVYAVVAVAVLAELGSDALASATAPLADAVTAAGHPAWRRWCGSGAGGGRARFAARTDPRGVAHDAGDGT